MPHAKKRKKKEKEKKEYTWPSNWDQLNTPHPRRPGFVSYGHIRERRIGTPAPWRCAVV
jgi:hypothetical protein